jgi:hypothetical protein
MQRNTAADLRTERARERAHALHREPQPHAALAAANRALDLLEPCIEAAIADRELSHDQSLVVVVVDPGAPAGSALEDAILLHREFGRAASVEVDYARYALDKARASLREQCDTALLRERGSALLTADLPLVGGLHRRGWTVGVSGAVPQFDEAIGGMFIELVAAILSHDASPAAAGANAR